VEWFGRCSCPRQRSKLARGANDEEHAMSDKDKQLFRNAAIDGREMTQWVIHVISAAGSDFRFTPASDRIAALR
jgi:hypothetical protein